MTDEISISSKISVEWKNKTTHQNWEKYGIDFENQDLAKQFIEAEIKKGAQNYMFKIVKTTTITEVLKVV